MVLASIVFLGSESLGIRDRILLSQISDFPFRRLLRLAGSRWRYSTPPPQVRIKVMLRPTVSSASLSWNKAPIRGLRPDLYYCQTVAGLLMWGALLLRVTLPLSRNGCFSGFTVLEQICHSIVCKMNSIWLTMGNSTWQFLDQLSYSSCVT
jgi:hypothetical protein